MLRMISCFLAGFLFAMGILILWLTFRFFPAYNFNVENLQKCQREMDQAMAQGIKRGLVIHD